MDASDVIHESLLGQLLIVFLFKAEQGLRHALDILQMVGSFLLERMLIYLLLAARKIPGKTDVSYYTESSSQTIDANYMYKNTIFHKL